MPLYEYQCLECGKKTEELQGFNDPPLAACPVCGGAVKKLVSSPAFQFKGSGWYVTDYAGKKGGDTGSSSAKPDSKAEGKSESKPAASAGEKAEAKPKEAPAAATKASTD